MNRSILSCPQQPSFEMKNLQTISKGETKKYYSSIIPIHISLNFCYFDRYKLLENREKEKERNKSEITRLRIEWERKMMRNRTRIVTIILSFIFFFSFRNYHGATALNHRIHNHVIRILYQQCGGV